MPRAEKLEGDKIAANNKFCHTINMDSYLLKGILAMYPLPVEQSLNKNHT